MPSPSVTAWGTYHVVFHMYVNNFKNLIQKIGSIIISGCSMGNILPYLSTVMTRLRPHRPEYFMECDNLNEMVVVNKHQLPLRLAQKLPQT